MMDLDGALAVFGHTKFRPGQREAIEQLLEHGRLLYVAPTGGGKSLVYQLPAIVLPGITVVVSPLLALMRDQTEALAARAIPALWLGSDVTAIETRERLRAIKYGEVTLVYVSPERLGDPSFVEALADVDISLVAVDEAHCISQWGGDFRPDYRRIGDWLRTLPDNTRVLACTASASPDVRREIIESLGLGTNTPVICGGFARPNLALRALEANTAAERRAAIDAELAEVLGGPGQRRGCAIIYAPTRKIAETEAERLAARGWSTDSYHARLPAKQRADAQQRFASGELEVMVATNAFGMGIDRADVRAVIHWGPPESLAAAYQEIGRAGRDGLPARCLMLHAACDIPQRFRLLERSTKNPTVLERKKSAFMAVIGWVRGGTCRHDALLRHFGDPETLGGCGRCDNCEALRASDVDATTVRKLLSGVARVSGRFGLTACVALLAGHDDARLHRSGLDKVSTFGALAELSADWLKDALLRCVAAGWAAFTSGARPVLRLTETGRAVMLGQRPPRILLPS